MIYFNNNTIKTSYVLYLNCFQFNNYGIQNITKQNNLNTNNIEIKNTNFSKIDYLNTTDIEFNEQIRKRYNSIKPKEEKIKNKEILLNNKNIRIFEKFRRFSFINKDIRTKVSEKNLIFKTYLYSNKKNNSYLISALKEFIIALTTEKYFNFFTMSEELIFPKKCIDYDFSKIHKLKKMGGEASFYFTSKKDNIEVFGKIFSKLNNNNKIYFEYNIFKEYAICNFLDILGVKNISKPLGLYETKDNFIIEYQKYDLSLQDFLDKIHYEYNFIDENTHICLFMVMKDIIKAVHDIHNKGIVHLDIKNDNIMIKYKDKYKKTAEGYLIDFGFSEIYKRKIKKLAGTEEFIHPDIKDAVYKDKYKKNKSFDGKKADLFALGVTFLYSFFYCMDKSCYKCKKYENMEEPEEVYCPIIFFGYRFIVNKDISGFKNYLQRLIIANNNDDCNGQLYNLFTEYGINIKIHKYYYDLDGLLKFKKIFTDKIFYNFYENIIDVISKLITLNPIDTKLLLNSNFYFELCKLINS